MNKEMDICPQCSGSGEGVADTICGLCNGSGGVPMTPPPLVVQASDREAEACQRLGAWLSAALDDPNAGEAFKADIRAWFEAGGDRMGAATEAAGSASVGVSREEVARIIRDYCRGGVQQEPFDGPLDTVDLAVDAILAAIQGPSS